MEHQLSENVSFSIFVHRCFVPNCVTIAYSETKAEKEALDQLKIVENISILRWMWLTWKDSSDPTESKKTSTDNWLKSEMTKVLVIAPPSGQIAPLSKLQYM